MIGKSEGRQSFALPVGFCVYNALSSDAVQFTDYLVEIINSASDLQSRRILSRNQLMPGMQRAWGE